MYSLEHSLIWSVCLSVYIDTCCHCIRLCLNLMCLYCETHGGKVVLQACKFLYILYLLDLCCANKDWYVYTECHDKYFLENSSIISNVCFGFLQYCWTLFVVMKDTDQLEYLQSESPCWPHGAYVNPELYIQKKAKILITLAIVA